MARERKRTITKRDGKLYARVRFKDETGKRRDLWRRAESRTHARQLIRELLRAIENSTAVALDAANMTFEDLAAYFEKHHQPRARPRRTISSTAPSSRSCPFIGRWGANASASSRTKWSGARFLW